MGTRTVRLPDSDMAEAAGRADMHFRTGTSALVADRIDEAIEELELCIAAVQAPLRTRQNAANNLLGALLRRYEKQSRARDDSMQIVVRMLEVRELMDPSGWPDADFTIGNVLVDIFDRWGVLEDLQAGSDLLRRSLAGGERPSWSSIETIQRYAETIRRLDNTHERRPDQRVDAVTDAVAFLREAVVLTDRDAPADRASARFNLASMLRLRGMLQGTRGDADTAEAISLLAQARDANPPASLLCAIENVEGLCWKDRRSADPEALSREIAAFERAAASHQPDSPVPLPLLERNLAIALGERALHPRGPADDLDRATSLFRNSVNGASDLQGAELSTLNWAGLAHRAHRWSEVIEAGTAALSMLTRGSREQVSFQAASLFGIPLSRVGRLMANAYIQLDDPLSAAMTIESFRSLAATALGAANAPGGLHATVDAFSAHLRDVVGDAVLVYLIEVDDEIVTLVLPPHGEPVVWRERVDDLGPGLASYLLAFSEFNAACRTQLRRADLVRFDENLAEVGEWLGRTVLTGVNRLVTTDSELFIVATGNLALAPLQIGTVRCGAGAGPLLERHPLSFVYNVSRLRRAPSPVELRKPLVVADPGRHGELRAVDVECRAAADALTRDGQTPVPVGTAHDLARGLHGADVLHCACHAAFDELSPMSSALQLKDRPVSLGEIQRLRVQLQLGFLSACETAVIAPLTPDEGVSLGHAFNLAGAEHVVATSWPVVDSAAATVAIHFYELLSEGGPRSISAALQEAQMRTRANSGAAGALSHRYLPQLRTPSAPPVPIPMWGGFVHTCG